MPVRAGSYRPANGCDGMDFMERWCDRCKQDVAYQRGDGDSCEIVCRTLIYDVGDPEYPAEWVYDAVGRPCCTAFVALDE